MRVSGIVCDGARAVQLNSPELVTDLRNEGQFCPIRLLCALAKQVSHCDGADIARETWSRKVLQLSTSTAKIKYDGGSRTSDATKVKCLTVEVRIRRRAGVPSTSNRGRQTVEVTEGGSTAPRGCTRLELSKMTFADCE